MARARPTAPSVALFPFLSILVCLIGAIVVMICLLTIIQAMHMGGRPRKEVQLAMDYVAAQRQIEARQSELAAVRAQTDRNDETKRKREELEQRIVQLNLQLDLAKDSKQTNEELQRQLELAIIQLAEMTKEKPPIVDELKRLRKELAARKIDPSELVPKVVIQPGGEGLAKGGNLFFAEAAAGALTIYKSKTDKAVITAGSIGADEQYNAYLEKVAATPGATLIFLIRDDGWHSYVRGAGWAEGSYKIKTAKLPLPGKGAINFGQFEGLMKK